MFPFSRHTTGWTIVCAVLLTGGLSLSPLPDDWRPLPTLRERPQEVVASLVGRTLRRPPKSLQAVIPGPASPTPGATGPTGATEPSGTDAGEETPGVPLSLESEAALFASLGADAMSQARSLGALGRTVGAKTLPIEDFCRTPEDEALCETRALDPFLTALHEVVEEGRRRPVRVLHLGDSLIASDHITDVIRDRLQLRYGSAGRGLLLVDRPTRGIGRAVRAGTASEGWVVRKITDKEGGEGRPLGLTGVTWLAAAEEGQTTDFEAKGARSAELFFSTDPKGGSLTVHADGKRVGTIFTRMAKREPGFARVSVPAHAKTVSVATSGEVQLDGVALESNAPGIVYDAFGLPGATAKVLLDLDRETFRKQLAQRAPAMVVLMLGGNEAFELSRGRGSLEAVGKSYLSLLDRVAEAAPEATCLLIGPMDAGVRNMRGDVVARSTTRDVAKLVREVARKRGCAFWDMQAAMGGEGSVLRWLEAGLMNEDLVHPLGRGGDLLGHLFDLSLARTAIERKSDTLLVDPPGLTRAQGDLDRTFAKLRTLEREKTGRVAIVQFGASHTAAHFFTDRLRSKLQNRFGDAGRGYVAIGKSSPRLKGASVERALTGAWDVQDALKQSPGQPWGLTGIRAEGTPGSAATVRFCMGCPPDKVKTRLALYYLAAPGSGRIVVSLDGQPLTELNGELPAAPEARIYETETIGASHALTAKNAGGGQISLFGVSSERDRPGVVYDALGLSGATIFHLAQMDAEALRSQVASRRADLFVFFYGTNESALPTLDVELMKRTYATVFQTLFDAAPDAECLFIGPTDRLQQTREGKWVSAPSQEKVIQGLREVATAHGCAFWSARAAMGGKASIARWLTRSTPLAHPDRVHLTPVGYTALADSLLDALLDAYAAERREGK